MTRWLNRLLGLTLLCIASGAVAQVRINEICAVASDRLIRWDETGRARVGAGVNWYDAGFDALGWSNGTGPVGMGAGGTIDVQAQMLGTTPSVYMRKTFSASVAQATHPENLTLEVEYTDGFVAYLNGKEIARKNAGAPGAPFMHDQVAFNGVSSRVTGFGNTHWIETLILDTAGSLLQAGDNVLSIQSHNNDIYLLDTTLYCKVTLKSGGGQVLANYDGDWNWFVGTHEPSGGVVDYGAEPETVSPWAWTKLDFDDQSWATGSGILGYSTKDTGPTLGTDLESRLSGITGTLYLRKEFSVSEPSGTLEFSVDYDDGFVAFLNGVEIARSSNTGDPGTFVSNADFAAGFHNLGNPDIISLGVASNWLVPGENVLAIQVLNHSLTSSDLFIIPNLYTLEGTAHVQDTDTWHYFVGTQEPIPQLKVPDDVDSDFLDWVELKNEGTQPVSLAGWSLTDDAGNSDQWIFPDVTLPVGGFLLVACSGKDIRNTMVPLLHTSFSLNRGGDYLGLYNASGTLVTEIAPEYPKQHPFYTYGWDETAGTYCYQILPTPGLENAGATFTVLPEPPEFSVDSGFYEGSVHVVISTLLAGGSIYYTTDGSAPTTANGTLYTAPLAIYANTALRAAVVSAEGIVSDPATRTLLMNVPDALQSLPAVVLTAEEERSLFGPYGITTILGESYTNRIWEPLSSDEYNIPIMHGRPFERRVCFEMFKAGTNLWTQVDCGVKLAASSWTRPQLDFDNLSNLWDGSPTDNKVQFNVFLRTIYGDDSVKNRFFENSSLKNTEQFRIRSGKNDSRNPFIKDEFVRRLYSDMGQAGSVGTLAGLWVNGQFRCYYNPVERYCEAFYQAHFDSDQKWDALSHDNSVPEKYAPYEGDDVAWLEMFDYVANHDMFVLSEYQGLTERLDPENYADYVLINAYFAPGDWGGNNWHAARERSINGRFRYHLWDAEMAMNRYLKDDEGNRIGLDLNYNMFTTILQQDHYIGKLYKTISMSEEFAVMMQDRVAEHFFNGGPLEDAHIQTRYDELVDELNPMMNYIRNTSVSRSQADDWIAGRRPYFLQQLRDAGYWHDISSPLISPVGSNYVGQIEVTISHTNSSGVIYYTLDSSDPRAPGGAIHGTPYSAPIELNQSIQVKARVLKSGVWGPLAKAIFPRDNTDLLLTEVHYNPSDAAGEDTEFVEFQNTGTHSLSLDGFGIDGGIDFEFGPGTLAPGAYGVVVRDLDAFAAHYNTNGMQVAGEYAGKLSNDGEAIRLEFQGKKLFEVAYNDARGWPVAANGGGPSLVPLNGAIAGQGFDILDYPGNWRASTYNGGSPGMADPDPLPGIVINEMVAHTDTRDPVPFESNDQIELFNPTASSIVLDGNWYLSDDLDEPQQWNIPSETTIPAGGWVVFDENDFHLDRVNGFGLNKSGELVMLSHRPGEGMDRVVDCVEFKGQENGFSWGRYPDGDAYFQTLEVTPNAANQLLSELGVRIQALMYNPKPLDLYDADEVLEFIQLTNGSPFAVNFVGESVTNTWRLNGGIDYSFAEGTSMAAGETLWVVPFNPVLEAEKKTIFCATYGLNAASVRLVGPWKGDLSNSGERVTLEKAQASDDLLQPDDISWIIVDEIIWLDEAPWPLEADGSGRPLLRTGAAGNNPDCWIAPADFDADTLPDNWELSLRPDLGDLGTGDFDGDGQTDREEYIAGTVPLDADSFFSFDGSPVGDDYLLNWSSVSGRVYSVYWSSNLHLPFILLGEANFPTHSYIIDIDESEDAVFFRIGVWTNTAQMK